MSDETVPRFDPGVQGEARVRHAVTTCGRELREVAASGLRLGVDQYDELLRLLDEVAPFDTTEGGDR